jgi:NodT family efflux transporter outer membrane factor (OMF) lipoprotein
MKTTMKTRLSAIALAAALCGCAVGPTYEVPASAGTQPAAAFKEAEGWTRAAPADALDRGPWWALFGDPLLDQLAAQVEVNNHKQALAAAQYAQARAVVAEQRSALFPVVSLGGSGTRSGGGGSTQASNNYRVDIGGSWEPDIWGSLRAGVTGARASAQASAALLASARLSAQGELVANYIGLRQADVEKQILDTTVTGYERVLQITQNRVNAGVTAKSDLLQAQTQLYSARADQLTVIRQRAVYEHAIAVLLGKAPAGFALAPAAWNIVVPEVPLGVPSTLLQRRPDIAAAERNVAASNENIGIARAAYFPSFSLSASYGYGNSSVGSLFSASNSLWSLGVSAAQAVFNAGATDARVDQAKASRDAAIAQYRQTVLNAFADVEDQLAATRALAQQQELRRQASEAADQVEQQMENRYRAGQVNYTDVVSAQVTALSARRALIQVQADRQTTAVALIQSLGGGWHVAP